MLVYIFLGSSAPAALSGPWNTKVKKFETWSSRKCTPDCSLYELRSEAYLDNNDRVTDDRRMDIPEQKNAWSARPIERLAGRCMKSDDVVVWKLRSAAVAKLGE